MVLMIRLTGLARCSILVVLVLVNVALAEAQDRVWPVAETTAAAQPPSEVPQPWLYAVHGGVYSADGFGFLGGGVTLPAAQRLWFAPNGEWLFVRNIDRMFTLNADLHYDVPVDCSVLPWVGAGIGVRHFAKGGGWPPEHSLGFNLIGGFGFPHQVSGVTPVIQGKVFIAGETLFANTAEFVMSAGLRF